MSCPVKKGSTKKTKTKLSGKREDKHLAGALDLLSAVAKVSVQPKSVC